MQELKRARRRTMIIDRPLQSRIILSMSWPAAAGLVVCSVLLGTFCYRLTDEALAAQVELPSVMPVFFSAISFLLVAGMFVFFNAVRFSNRVAGPVYRLKKTLEGVQNGDLRARATLRDGDLLFDLSDGLNGFLDWLQEHPPQGMDVMEASTAASQAADVAETVEVAEAVNATEAGDPASRPAEVSIDDVPSPPVAAEKLADVGRNGVEKA